MFDLASQVRGGSVDALIVLATQTIKNDFLYQVRVLMGTKDNSTKTNSQEAFLTTYRTFIAPELLIAKLVYRWSLILPTLVSS